MFRIWFKFMPVNPKDLDPRVPFQTVACCLGLEETSADMQSFADVERCLSYMHNVAPTVLLPQFSSRVMWQKKMELAMDI
jgi:hypothetical protein